MATFGKKWIVGLDLGARSEGALHFGAWLAAQGGDRLIAVHVLESDQLMVALRYHHLDEVHASARNAAEAAIDRIGGLRGALSSVEVLEGQRAEDTLVAARTYHHCDGLIIGRNAPREGMHAVRLGRVARRVLRALPSPVFVVPPDLLPEQIGAGPVLFGCDLEEDAAPAAEFARSFAERFSRTIELVHVAAVPDAHGAQYLPLRTVAKIRAEHTADAEQRLTAWAAAHGLAGAVCTVRLGNITDSLLALARERGAVAIVLGSRRLSVFERWLLTSAGSDLAGHAGCPVAIVPPT